jgi:hypothetical protein
MKTSPCQRLLLAVSATQLLEINALTKLGATAKNREEAFARA